MFRSIFIYGLWFALNPLSAQSDLTILSAGYSAPAMIEVAPGQVITLFFRGVKSGPNGFLRSGNATSTPLPVTLAGLSAQIYQLPRTQPFQVPLLAVRQQNECDEISSRPVCLLTSVRVQIPTELTPTVAKLVLSEDGQPSRTFLLRPVRENIHLITTCDLDWDTNPASTCNRLIYHADGRLADEKAPAYRGEWLTFYAHGLGPTTPTVPSGTAAPSGVQLLQGGRGQFRVGFQILVNAPSSLPRIVEPDAPGRVDATLSIGLTPGQVGLYQINVRVPETLEVPMACGGEIRTNAIARVATTYGVENIALCVSP